ncbi:MAG: hypothetical protein CMC18_05450 [Flavobacteriaceae bacterium]|nr:hypothetical protein [Flavobacteriaceae bacterium]
MQKTILYYILIFIFPFCCLSQAKQEYFFKGSINVNNNGIDWVPIFSRDKPSIIANFSLGKDRFSVNPLIRYELDGFQPWGLDIWWNYIIKKQGKFNFDLGGVFPGVINQRINVINEDLPNTILQPWVAAIVNPNISYSLSSNLKLTLSYYEILPIKIVNKMQIESGRIIILSSAMKPLSISNKIYLNWSPLIYAVQLENSKTGFFSAQTFNIGIVNSPFSISSVINKPIYFGDLSGKSFNWNLGLNYTFDLKFIKRD